MSNGELADEQKEQYVDILSYIKTLGVNVDDWQRGLAGDPFDPKLIEIVREVAGKDIILFEAPVLDHEGEEISPRIANREIGESIVFYQYGVGPNDIYFIIKPGPGEVAQTWYKPKTKDKRMTIEKGLEEFKKGGRDIFASEEDAKKVPIGFPRLSESHREFVENIGKEFVQRLTDEMNITWDRRSQDEVPRSNKQAFIDGFMVPQMQLEEAIWDFYLSTGIELPTQHDEGVEDWNESLFRFISTLTKFFPESDPAAGQPLDPVAADQPLDPVAGQPWFLKPHWLTDRLSKVQNNISDSITTDPVLYTREKRLLSAIRAMADAGLVPKKLMDAPGGTLDDEKHAEYLEYLVANLDASENTYLEGVAKEDYSDWDDFINKEIITPMRQVTRPRILSYRIWDIEQDREGELSEKHRQQIQTMTSTGGNIKAMYSSILDNAFPESGYEGFDKDVLDADIEILKRKWNQGEPGEQRFDVWIEAQVLAESIKERSDNEKRAKSRQDFIEGEFKDTDKALNAWLSDNGVEVPPAVFELMSQEARRYKEDYDRYGETDPLAIAEFYNNIRDDMDARTTPTITGVMQGPMDPEQGTWVEKTSEDIFREITRQAKDWTKEDQIAWNRENGIEMSPQDLAMAQRRVAEQGMSYLEEVKANKNYFNNNKIVYDVNRDTKDFVTKWYLDLGVINPDSTPGFIKHIMDNGINPISDSLSIMLYQNPDITAREINEYLEQRNDALPTSVTNEEAFIESERLSIEQFRAPHLGPPSIPLLYTTDFATGERPRMPREPKVDPEAFREQIASVAGEETPSFLRFFLKKEPQLAQEYARSLLPTVDTEVYDSKLKSLMGTISAMGPAPADVPAIPAPLRAPVDISVPDDEAKLTWAQKHTRDWKKVPLGQITSLARRQATTQPEQRTKEEWLQQRMPALRKEFGETEAGILEKSMTARPQRRRRPLSIFRKGRRRP